MQLFISAVMASRRITRSFKKNQDGIVQSDENTADINFDQSADKENASQQECDFLKKPSEKTYRKNEKIQRKTSKAEEMLQKETQKIEKEKKAMRKKLKNLENLSNNDALEMDKENILAVNEESDAGENSYDKEFVAEYFQLLMEKCDLEMENWRLKRILSEAEK
uniref:Uncharacterized protein n=1 Tax=Panagrolaimus sp. ES5 TaxID=591445 RepID=A0AC34F5Z5_9BILA